MASRHSQEPVPVYDSLDIDLVVKVLNHTVFSKCLRSLVIYLL